MQKCRLQWAGHGVGAIQHRKVARCPAVIHGLLDLLNDSLGHMFFIAVQMEGYRRSSCLKGMWVLFQTVGVMANQLAGRRNDAVGGTIIAFELVNSGTEFLDKAF